MNPNQLVLLSEPRAQHDAPDTSMVAAAKVKPGHTRRLALIEEWVDSAGLYGMTADECWQKACVDDPSQLSKKSTWHGAVSQTAKAGLIVPKGPKCVRLSVNHTPMRIYIHPRFVRGNQ